MKYYHFSTWQREQINLDTVYRTPETFSHYWTQKVSQSPVPENDPLYVATIKLYGAITNDSSFCTQKATEIVKKKYQIEIQKEYLFEEIRLAEFPHRPSRTRCMFLLPTDLDPIQYMTNMGFSPAERTIFEIEILEEVEAKVHYANYSLLNCNAHSDYTKKEYARKYWEGRKDIDLGSEVLFEGKFRISRIL